MGSDATTPEDTRNGTRTSKVRRRLLWSAGLAVAVLIAFSGAALWFASNQLLSPAWRGVTKDLSVCEPEAEKHWGQDCGNLRETPPVRVPGGEGSRDQRLRPTGLDDQHGREQVGARTRRDHAGSLGRR